MAKTCPSEMNTEREIELATRLVKAVEKMADRLDWLCDLVEREETTGDEQWEPTAKEYAESEG